MIKYKVYQHESPGDSYEYESTEIVREGAEGDRAPDDILTLSQGGQQIKLYVCELTELLYNVGYALVPSKTD